MTEISIVQQFRGTTTDLLLKILKTPQRFRILYQLHVTICKQKHNKNSFCFIEAIKRTEKILCPFVIFLALLGAIYFRFAQMRYNLPFGMLRYDIDPTVSRRDISYRRYIAPKGISRIPQGIYIASVFSLKTQNPPRAPARN